jgi:hypothetical protein
MKNLFLILSILLLNSCAAWPWTKTAYDQWRETCGKALESRVEIQNESRARGISVGDLAEALCELSDVVAPFVRNKAWGTRATNPADEAISAARALGAIQ